MQSDSDSSPTGWGPSSRAPTLVGSPQPSPPLNQLKPPPSCDDFGVAIMCALPIEATAVTALFDEQWDHGALDKAKTDTNQYSVGSIAGCGVVLAHMPAMGKAASATVAAHLRYSFHYLRLVLLVGICGGAPKPPGKGSDELFLGDVVVSTGVVQYDLGRRFPGRFVRKDTPQDNLSRLSVEADSVLARLRTDQAKEEFGRSVFRHLAVLQERLGSKAVHPGRSKDRLFQPDYLHKHRETAECSDCAVSAAAACDRAMEKTCEELGCGQQPSDLVSRLRPADTLQPAVHFGLFGSGDTVMRSGRDRDEIAAQNGGVMAFEMEAAGMWEIMRAASCLVVKSICDYSDSHKNKMFQSYAAAVAAATAKALLQSWDAYMPKSLQPLHPRPSPRNKRPPLTAHEIKLLNKLNTVPYTDRKDRNPHRVPGTCEWFVGHKLFRSWLESEGGKASSNALWVSADPGCGKSVLARHLVDDVLPSTETRTTCYFFFKDDFEDQKSAVNALCCILHQLFTRKSALFSDATRARLEAEGPQLSLSFRDLWDMLLEAADDEGAGEILCILDALDECKGEDRSRLINALVELRHTKRAPNLKFLLTSRPYGTIRRSFQLPDAADLAVVHLSGENEVEVEQISKEIDIFIKARVQGIGARLMLDEPQKDLLLRGLLSVPHRTYLWVYLTLNLIENDENINKGKIRRALSQLPKSVDGAYEKVLSASRDPDEARRALHIIVAAERPLTLGEMNFALALRPSHHSYKDVDLASDEWFRERLRDICGLFVTVIEARIYLLHQTAREFLVNLDTDHKPSATEEMEEKEGEEREEKDDLPKLRWKHSLQPSESHRILGEICLWNLQFPEWHDDPISGDYTQLLHHIREFKFLEYSVFYWTVHLTAPHVKIDIQMTEAILDICRVCHQHRPFWFRVAAKNYTIRQNNVMHPSIADEPNKTLLMVASFFGIAPAVEALIKRGGGGGLLARDSQGRTALSWAAVYGHRDAARTLIDSQPGVLKGLGWLGLWKPAILEAADNTGITPLMYAARGESASVAGLLLDRGADLEARDDRGGTALWWVAYNPLCGAVVRLLLDRGANIEIKDGNGEGPLYNAAQHPDPDAARLLLSYGADVNSRNGPQGETPLMAAIERERMATVTLLLRHKADIDARTKNGRTAFLLACRTGQLDLVKLLLDAGADVESQDSFGMSALAEACLNGHEAVARFLIEHGANVESRSVFGQTVLYYAWARGMPYANESVPVANLVLENGANVNAKDSQGTSVLAAVAAFGNGVGVQWLLDHGADLESEDVHGRTPLAWAVSQAFDDKAIPALLQAGANVNAKDRDGRSVLHMATNKVSTSVIKLLIQYGADPHAVDKDGNLPLVLLAMPSASVPESQVRFSRSH